MSDTISIEGLDKLTLLHKLWLNAPVASFFSTGIIPPPAFNFVQAQSVLDNYIDYFCGRPIKMNLSGDSILPSLYDRDAPNPASSVVASMRADQA